jgi:hypothetical protein
MDSELSGGRSKKFETRAIILAATLLCEMGRAPDPRLRGVVKIPLMLRALTFREAHQVLEDYGVRTTG